MAVRWKFGWEKPFCSHVRGDWLQHDGGASISCDAHFPLHVFCGTKRNAYFRRWKCSRFHDIWTYIFCIRYYFAFSQEPRKLYWNKKHENNMWRVAPYMVRPELLFSNAHAQGVVHSYGSSGVPFRGRPVLNAIRRAPRFFFARLRTDSRHASLYQFFFMANKNLTAA